jgi:hypothetical protein
MATYAAFDRDLIAAVVLGDVVHHHVSALVGGGARSARAIATAADRLARDGRTTLRPAHAFAIAQATGIPRQTVRRKIAALVAGGLLDRGPNGRLYVSRQALAVLSDFHFERLADLIDTAGLIGEVLQLEPAGRLALAPARRPRTRRRS